MGCHRSPHSVEKHLHFYDSGQTEGRSIPDQARNVSFQNDVTRPFLTPSSSIALHSGRGAFDCMFVFFLIVSFQHTRTQEHKCIPAVFKYKLLAQELLFLPLLCPSLVPTRQPPQVGLHVYGTNIYRLTSGVNDRNCVRCLPK